MRGWPSGAPVCGKMSPEPVPRPMGVGPVQQGGLSGRGASQCSGGVASWTAHAAAVWEGRAAGAWLPWAQAAEVLACCPGVTVSTAMVRGLTGGTGAADEAR
jgi:hypothetical protein